MHPVVIAVHLRSNTQQHSHSSIGGSPHDCDWRFSAMGFGRMTSQLESIGSSAGLVPTKALVAINRPNPVIGQQQLLTKPAVQNTADFYPGEGQRDFCPIGPLSRVPNFGPAARAPACAPRNN